MAVFPGTSGNDFYSGGPSDDIIYGLAGFDRLIGGGGNDQIYGGDDDDYLTGGNGDDLIDGGSGFDRAGWYQTNPALGGVTVSLQLQGIAQYTGSQGWDTLIGIEYLSGTPFADTLTGDDDNNVLWGSAATIDFASGNVSTTNDDSIDGAGGDDLIVVGIGNHSINGGSGIDSLSFTENFGNDPAVVISLALQGAPQDTGQGSWTISNIENLSGGTGGDTLTGDGGANVLAGHAGGDTLVGAAGNDTLYGDGMIRVNATASGGGSGFVETVADAGFAGNDLLEGGLGNDILDGGGGIDTASYADAGGGVQVFLYGAGSGESYGADGEDQLSNIENVIGSAFGDTLSGDNFDNVLSGGEGDDFLRGNGGNDQLLGGDGNDFLGNGAGDDLLDGGSGFDRVSHFTGATAGVTVDLRIVGAQNTGQGMDTYVGIEHVSGTLFADVLTGNDGDNWIWGSPATLGDGSVVTGNDDVIDGQGGNDLIGVGIGNHAIDGGSGVDTLYFTENQSNDPAVVVSLALQGVSQITGQGSWTITNVENLSGGTNNDTLTGDSNANVLAGNGGNDTLIGGGGNDTLYGDGAIQASTSVGGGSGPIATVADTGAGGNDLLEGGLGNDILNGGGGIDTASYANAGGNVTVNLGTGTSFGADGNDTLANIENVIGSNFNDTITGNADANVLDGLGGNDFISGGAGDDVISGGDGDDFLQGDLAENNISVTGNDQMYGGNGNDNLRGGLGNDQLYGGSGNDLMRGNGGADYFDGGADDGVGFNGIGDRVSFFDRRATQGAVADLRTGTISNDGFGNVETMIGIESLGADTAYVDTFHGNDGANFIGGSRGDYLYGHGGDDQFQTGAAAAVIDGGSGLDTLGLDTTGGWLLADADGDGLAESAAAMAAGWTVNLTTGTMVDGYGNSGSVTGIEHINGSQLDDVLIGDNQPNTLRGGDGNDILEGRGSQDTLDGGNGIDTSSYASAAGPVTVVLTATGGSSSRTDGNDILISIENVIGSAFDDSINGNSLDNRLEGSAGRDFLRGNAGNDQAFGGDGDDFLGNGAGDDLLDGGNGFDRVSHFNGATAGVTVDLRIQGIAQNTGQGMDTFVGIEHVSGTLFGDTLTGNDGDNWIWGSPATIDPETGEISADNNDAIDGQGGNDLIGVGIGNHLINGGTGIDTLYFTENTGVDPAVVISLALQGAAQNTTRGNWTITNVENLSGGTNNDTLTGDGGVNVLAGYSGSDTLIGGAGDDSLYGDGVFIADSALSGSSGPIAFFADANSYDPTQVSGNDTLEGGLGNDLINGGGGIDTASYANAAGGVTVNLAAGTASGADGNDTLVNIENVIGSAFADNITGNNQDNVLDGGDGHDFLRGLAGNDTLLGGVGDDFLSGSVGDDHLDGGAGWDRVSFFTGATSGVTVNLNLQGVAQNTGLGMDTLVNIEHVSGTIYSDTFTGNAGDNWLWGTSDGEGGNDTLDGGDGNDLLDNGAGNHVLIGGTGTDTFRYVALNSTTGITVSLALQGAAQDTGRGMMTLTGIENLSGSGYADTFVGDDNANVLAGEQGDDILRGGAGNDTIYGDGAIAPDTHGNGGSGPITTYADVASIGGISGNDLLEGGLGNDTIDGGGGIDTASYANAGGNVTVNLTATGGSSSGADGNDTLVSIENLIGSAFNDTIGGNALDNRLEGGGGADLLFGRLGDDTLLGGDGHDFLRGEDGNDVLDGGLGKDRVSFAFLAAGETSGVTVDLNVQGVAQDTGHGMDTLIGIEHVSGTIYNDVLTGDGGDNWLWGGSNASGVTGNDTIQAGGGDDLVTVGAGNHTLGGGTGIDTLSLLGNSTDITTAGITFYLDRQGTAQNFEQGVIIATGFENVSGSIHDDFIYGDTGANILLGDAGNDTIRGDDGNDVLYGDGRISVDTGGTGGSGDIGLIRDITAGTSAAGGNDTLLGGRGNDILYGGRGNDVMTGNQGVDTYVIETQSGTDRVTDFAAGTDKVRFDGVAGVDDFGDLTLTKSGSDTIITWGTTDSLRIVGVKPTALGAADFEFAAAMTTAMSLYGGGSPMESAAYEAMLNPLIA